MAFTKEQLEIRKKGIGASEAAMALGLNPYPNATPLDLWMLKKGLKVTEETQAMRIGSRLEPIVAEMYQDATGFELVQPFTMLYPKNPIIYATPDRIVKGKNKGLEIKTANARMAENWGEEGTDEIPQQYLIQCILCMAVTDLPEWDVAVLIGGQDFRIYNIQRDVDLENSIIERLLEWWETYIIKNQEPDINSSKSYAEYLAIKYPKNFKSLKEADADAEQLIQRLGDVRDSLKSFEEQEETIKNLLKNYIGDSDGVQGAAGKCTWKACKDTKEIGWEALAKAVMGLYIQGEENKGKMLSLYTAHVPGVRRFLFSPTK